MSIGCEKCKEKEMLCYLISEGWKCGNCNYLYGENQDYDYHLFDIKIHDILQDMCEKEMIYISNSSIGEYLENNIQDACIKNNNYSSNYIIQIITMLKGLKIVSF